jgi:phosphoglycolate phosphatase-like HAD superfamily hydrolase
MKLVLFDIDGTLISDGGAARESFAVALDATYGYRGDLRRYDFSGRTDPQIARMILRDAGHSDAGIDARMPDLWDRYLSELAGNATGRVRELPGIRTVVDVLRDHPDVVLALLTGNIEQGARLKLAAPGLNDYFPFGAFGSDSEHREKLPPFAVSRAAQATGRHFTGSDVVIIGDSIYDVRCGTPHSARTIAIASGKTSAEALLAENPDHFFPTAEATDALLSAILAS